MPRTLPRYLRSRRRRALCAAPATALAVSTLIMVAPVTAAAAAVGLDASLTAAALAFARRAETARASAAARGDDDNLLGDGSLAQAVSGAQAYEACVAEALAKEGPAAELARSVRAQVAARVRCRRERAAASAATSAASIAPLPPPGGALDWAALGDGAGTIWELPDGGAGYDARAGNAAVGFDASTARSVAGRRAYGPGGYFSRGRPGAPLAGADTLEAGALMQRHQWAFSADGHSFAVDAYLADLDAHAQQLGGALVAVTVVLCSDLTGPPVPQPLTCRFSPADSGSGAPLRFAEARAALQLFGTRYAPRQVPPAEPFTDIHTYTIMCPVPEAVLQAVGLPPTAGSEADGAVVDGVRLSLVWRPEEGSADSDRKEQQWMLALSFRDVRLPSPAQPPDTDVAMCMSGAFGVGGGRFLPEYIEYHRALGVSRFEYFDMDAGGAAAGVLEAYARRGVVRLHDWSPVPGVSGLAGGAAVGNEELSWRSMGWRSLRNWQQGQTLTRQLCYWSVRRRARYMLINDLDEILALWRPPHTLQASLLPWMEAVHARSGGAVRGFSLRNKVAPPNLVADESLHAAVLGRAPWQQRRGETGRYHGGRWKYLLRVAEENATAILPPLWYHAIFHSSRGMVGEVLDKTMTLVPDGVSHLRHLVPYPRLADSSAERFPEDYDRVPLPEAPLRGALAAVRATPWLRRPYQESPSSLHPKDLARAGSGPGTLPITCAKAATRNYTFLCA